jgi:hypothetical protein
MRLKMTPIALAATLTLVAVLSTTSDIAHGGGHGACGDDGLGLHLSYPRVWRLSDRVTQFLRSSGLAFYDWADEVAAVTGLMTANGRCWLC